MIEHRNAADAVGESGRLHRRLHRGPRVGPEARGQAAARVLTAVIVVALRPIQPLKPLLEQIDKAGIDLQVLVIQRVAWVQRRGACHQVGRRTLYEGWLIHQVQP